LKRIEEDSADAEGLELLLRAPPGAMLLHSHHSHRPHGTESSHTFRSSAVRGESVADSPGKPDNPDAISMQLVRFWPKPEPPPPPFPLGPLVTPAFSAHPSLRH
jgi:hypothetical protein